MTKLKLSNPHLSNASQARQQPDAGHFIEVDALVDMQVTALALPKDIVDALGLTPRDTRRIRRADGQVVEGPWVGGITIEILGREMTCDAIVEAEGTTPVIGLIPLTGLDLVIDPESGDLCVNPASPDGLIINV